MRTFLLITFWASVLSLISIYGYTEVYGTKPELQFVNYITWGVLFVSGMFLQYGNWNKRPTKSSRPKLNSFVEITYLAPCRNASQRSKNPYIGMRGQVIDHFDDGGFSVRTDSSWLIVTNGDFDYKYVNKDSTFTESLKVSKFEKWYFGNDGPGAWAHDRPIDKLDTELLNEYFRYCNVPFGTVESNSDVVEIFKGNVIREWKLFNETNISMR